MCWQWPDSNVFMVEADNAKLSNIFKPTPTRQAQVLTARRWALEQPECGAATKVRPDQRANNPSSEVASFGLAQWTLGQISRDSRARSRCTDARVVVNSQSDQIAAVGRNSRFGARAESVREWGELRQVNELSSRAADQLRKEEAPAESVAHTPVVEFGVRECSRRRRRRRGTSARYPERASAVSHNGARGTNCVRQ